MIDAILLSLLASSPSALCALDPVMTVLPAGDEVKDAIRDAGSDIAKLLALAERWSSEQNESAARSAYERVLKLDSNNATARPGLRHHAFEGQWFETYASLSAHKREEARRMLTKGLVRFGDKWEPAADVPFMRMGYVKYEERWIAPQQKAEIEQAKQLSAQGYELQDLVWVEPASFDKWRAGLWKVGDKWLSKEDANKAHAEIANWWRVPAKHFNALTTCDRDTAGWVGWHADLVYPDLERLFGKRPQGKLDVVALNDIAQYNAFAGGDPALQLQATDATGASSVHYAYFADSWFDNTTQPARFRGVGVCYWDTADAALAPYGLHAVRHAAAQSYLEAIDPSWNAVANAVELGQFQANDFWAEKRIPLWLRYGAASYCERFFQDPNAAQGVSAWWAREWALENLRSKGGIRDLERVFAFVLDPADPDTSAQLIHEAGCVVAFLLDGDCAPVSEKHAAFQAAFVSGGATAEAAQALQKAIAKNKNKLEKFAGF
jgi:hypothetical protein